MAVYLSVTFVSVHADTVQRAVLLQQHYCLSTLLLHLLLQECL